MREHLLVSGIEKAFGWQDAGSLGQKVERGKLTDSTLNERLMTPSRLLDIITRRQLDPPRLRLFQDGRELHPDTFLRAGVNRRRQQVRMLDPESVTELLDAGVTLVLDGVETFDPVVEVATRALRWWSRELVQVNAYLTTRAADGFGLHWDDHDVIIVQLAGEKSWEVRAASRAAPMFRDAEPNDTPSDEIVWRGILRPGDVLHIPRGHWHQATRPDHQEPVSLHLTFGFTRRTGVDWLAWIADQARGQELFRHDLLRSASPAALEDERGRLTQAAVALLRSLSPADFLAAREQGQPSARLAPVVPSAGDPAAVVCVTEFPPRLEPDGRNPDGRNIVVQAAGKRIVFRDRAAPALDLLLSGTPVDVASLGARTGLDARPLARVLVREGICAALTPELAAGYTGLIPAGPCSSE